MTTRIPSNLVTPAALATQLSTLRPDPRVTTPQVRPALPQQHQGIMPGGCYRDDFFPQGPRGGCFPGGHPLPGPWSPLDLGALVELNTLDQTPGPIGAREMMEAIERGTADLDGQSASGEFRAFAEWAQRNGARLTPEARQVMDVYAKYAAKAQGQGQSGIALSDWNAMLKEMKGVKDGSAQRALADLDRKPAPISGEDMAKAIQRGAGDRDGQTAAEVDAFRQWAQKNASKLSPEAKEVLGIFEKHAKGAEAKGQKDLSRGEWSRMLREFRGVGDVSARKALDTLDKEQGPISGEDMLQAIREGVSDADGHSTKSELREFQQWARENKERLTPEARKVLETYEKHAKAAGPEGMSTAQFDRMLKEMGQYKTFRDNSMRDALEGLDAKKGPISGKDLMDAINQGAGDGDGQAAGVEFADLQKWARMNRERLSPEARKVLGIYEKHATRAMARGQTGIDHADFQRMLREMRVASQPMHRPVLAA